MLTLKQSNKQPQVGTDSFGKHIPEELSGIILILTILCSQQQSNMLVKDYVLNFRADDIVPLYLHRLSIPAKEYLAQLELAIHVLSNNGELEVGIEVAVSVTLVVNSMDRENV